MKKLFAAAFLAVIGMALMPASANATFELHLHSSNGADLILTDGDGDGVISFAGAFGGFSITVDTAFSKPTLGSAAAPAMELNYTASKALGSPGLTLTIETSDQGFTTSPIDLASHVGGTNVNSSSTYTASYDNGNVLFGTGGGSTPSFTSNALSFQNDTILHVTGGTPYSLTLKVVVVAGAGRSNFGGDATLNTIASTPAPSGAILVLGAVPILVLGVWLRRRRQHEVAAAASIA